MQKTLTDYDQLQKLRYEVVLIQTKGTGLQAQNRQSQWGGGKQSCLVDETGHVQVAKRGAPHSEGRQCPRNQNGRDTVYEGQARSAPSHWAKSEGEGKHDPRDLWGGRRTHEIWAGQQDRKAGFRWRGAWQTRAGALEGRGRAYRTLVTNVKPRRDAPKIQRLSTSVRLVWRQTYPRRFLLRPWFQRRFYPIRAHSQKLQDRIGPDISGAAASAASLTLGGLMTKAKISCANAVHVQRSCGRWVDALTIIVSKTRTPTTRLWAEGQVVNLHEIKLPSRTHWPVSDGREKGDSEFAALRKRSLDIVSHSVASISPLSTSHGPTTRKNATIRISKKLGGEMRSSCRFRDSRLDASIKSYIRLLQVTLTRFRKAQQANVRSLPCFRSLYTATLGTFSMPRGVKSAPDSPSFGTRVRPLYTHPGLTQLARRTGEPSPRIPSWWDAGTLAFFITGPIV